jgi:hypothetical protein
MRTRSQSRGLLFVLAALLFVSPVSATHHSSHGSSHRTAHSGSHGRIHRSAAAKAHFMEQHPCPSTGKTDGAWVRHRRVKPLACGGADDPSNMQWHTTAAGKAKDKVERKGC